MGLFLRFIFGVGFGRVWGGIGYRVGWIQGGLGLVWLGLGWA